MEHKTVNIKHFIENDRPFWKQLGRQRAVRVAVVVLVTAMLAGPWSAAAMADEANGADDDMAARRAAASQEQLERMLAEIEDQRPSAERREGWASVDLPGEGRLRLTDISLNIMSAVGTSTARGHELRDLQGGEHDPRRRGFNFQQAELGIGGAVDPLFYGEAYIVFDEEHIELEEAFFITQSMPWNLQLKGGYFLTEFGRVNPQHPHEWYWLDQPIINTRFFSGEGMRGAGARLGWLAPLPWYSQLKFTVQNATDDTMISFLGEGHDHDDDDHGHDDDHTLGGLDAIDRDEVRSLRDLVYTLRWANSFDLTSDITALVGVSGMYGPNRAGPRGETWIYGGDLTLKWQPEGAVWPFVSWQSEFMQRHFRPRGGAHHDNGHGHDDHGPGSLRDWGINSQLVYGFARNWTAGLRYEFVHGTDGSPEPRSEDPMRADRHRVSPLLMWQPSEFTRVRLQYNYDHADFLHHDDDAHSVWLGVDILLGSHPAHPF